MVSDKVNIDLNVDFEDNDYKSCFARSVAVNSQFKSKALDNLGVHQMLPKIHQPSPLSLPGGRRPFSVNDMETQAVSSDILVKLRRNSCNNGYKDESRRLSCGSINSSRRTSICSNRISEIPIENILNQSKVETLQWQLRETEKSREMYRAVMKQVVTFLEKAHHSLELLGSKINTMQMVPRSKSEHEIGTEDTIKDFTWRKPKREDVVPEEISPEKLSQEAFRLLRTAQSLLNTQEPKLAQSQEPDTDIEFLAQLAKEFPPQPPTEPKPQRTTSFSLCPKLLVPEPDVKISTAFNRKLSLQLHETRRNTYRDYTKLSNINSEVPSNSIQETKSNSPPAGSISSVEDESGFSSMNSFQDVGLPLINSDDISKGAFLKNLLQDSDVQEKSLGDVEDDFKLWQKPLDYINHKRWSSTPVNDSNSAKLSSTKVLWV